MGNETKTQSGKSYLPKSYSQKAEDDQSPEPHCESLFPFPNYYLLRVLGKAVNSLTDLGHSQSTSDMFSNSLPYTEWWFPEFFPH